MRYCWALERMVNEGIVHKGQNNLVRLGPIGGLDLPILRKDGEAITDAVQRMLIELNLKTQQPQVEKSMGSGNLDPAKEGNQTAKAQGSGNKGG